MTSPVRIEFSVFRPDYVSQLLSQRWGWKGTTCALWNHGISDTYRIAYQKKRAYLKIYRHGWRSRAELQGEIDLLRFLGRQNVRVVHPISSKTGVFLEPVHAPEGRRYAVLFSEADGVMPEFNVENSRKYGLLAGKFHSETDRIPSSTKRPRLGIDHLVRAPLESIRSFLQDRPRDLSYLTRISMDLADAVSKQLPVTEPEFGMCHGDLTYGNVRRDGKGRLTLFDFDCSGYGWRAYDVAVFLQSRGNEFSRSAVASRMRQWNAFMDGYHGVRSLSGQELQAVNLFVPLRQIWHLGMHTNHLAHTGRRSIRDANFEWRLEFIKNWLKAYKPL